MVWKLELVRSNDCAPIERITVCELGEILAPADLDDVGLDLRTSHRIVCDLQRTVVVVQERALKDKAVQMRQADPSLSLKDYRLRSVQTLFGTLSIRVPRLRRHGSRLPPPCLFRKSARSGTEYHELRSRLGALMSYRVAEQLIGHLFPFAVGRASSTTRRQLLRRASRLEADFGRSGPLNRNAANFIDLGIGTTFVRSNTAHSPRHHEVLIGVRTNDRGQTLKFAAVISTSATPHE